MIFVTIKEKGGETMNALSISLVIVSAMFAILFMAIRVWKGGLLAVMVKTLASLAFVSTGIIGIAVSDLTNKVPLALIAIGLLCGMVGDILLDLKVVYDNDKIYLNFGMLSFGLGHLAYFSAFTSLALTQISSVLVPVLVAVGAGIVLTVGTVVGGMKMMKLDFGKFLWQTVAYSFILTFMMTYTLVLAIMGGGMWLTFVGLLLFFLSDVVLSTQYFGGQLSNKLFIVINHTLYYAAQIVLATVVFLV